MTRGRALSRSRILRAKDCNYMLGRILALRKSQRARSTHKSIENHSEGGLPKRNSSGRRLRCSGHRPHPVSDNRRERLTDSLRIRLKTYTKVWVLASHSTDCGEGRSKALSDCTSARPSGVGCLLPSPRRRYNDHRYLARSCLALLRMPTHRGLKLRGEGGLFLLHSSDWLRLAMPHPVRNALIAIIDDDEGLCSSMVDLMRSIGYRAESFTSAEGFLASSSAALFDCVIADVHMRGMSGLDLVRKLREQGGAAPAILITALADKRLNDEAISAGAQCLLRKPFETKALLDCIERSLCNEQPPE